MWKTKGKKRKEAKQEVDNVLRDQSLDADRDSRITSSTTSIKHLSHESGQKVTFYYS